MGPQADDPTDFRSATSNADLGSNDRPAPADQLDDKNDQSQNEQDVNVPSNRMEANPPK